MFYEIESNIKMLEMAIRCDDELSTKISILLEDYLTEAKLYSKDINDNFGERLMKGNEIYSYLLIFLKFKNELTAEQLQELFKMLESLIEICLSIFKIDLDSEVPSFAEMSDALINILNNLNDFDTDDADTLLKDNEQILLNRIWLNVKVSCELVSAIGTLCDDRQLEQSCLYTLVNILQKNRHKGIIEAAGFAITNLVKYLTSNGNSEQVTYLKYNTSYKKFTRK